MTVNENFHRLMRGESYHHVPFDLPLTPPMVDELERQHGTRDAGAVFPIDFRYVWTAGPTSADHWRRAYSNLGIEVPEGAWVSDTGYVEKPADSADVGKAYHLTDMYHPLETIQDIRQLKSLPWHDLHDPTWYVPIAGQVRDIQNAGYVPTLGLECTIFESAWYLRSMEKLFEDIIEDNPIGSWLLDRFRDRSVLCAQAFTAAGGDLIRLGDDVGTQRGMMMSVPFWREHLKPRLADVISAARANGDVWIQYHSDGNVSAIMDDLIEIGVDILNPVQPECMDLDDVCPRWMDRIAFSGMIGTQTTMPFGSPDDVREAVAKCESWIRRGARMMIAPTHVLEPDVPWENVEALVKSVRGIDPTKA